MAFETMELQRITQTLTALLEYEWITNVRCIENMFIERAIALLEVKGNIYYNSEFNFWLEKARDMCMPIKEIYEAYDLSSPLYIKKAAKFWQRCGCVYNEAMTLFAGTNEEKRAALRMMQTLQAEAVVKKMKYQMRSSGIKKIPRGLRKSTLSNSALLTGRELDVLQLLKEGFQNKEVAGKLYISAKTVDHHISSILFKLDVNSRLKAVNEAFRQQILTK